MTRARLFAQRHVGGPRGREALIEAVEDGGATLGLVWRGNPLRDAFEPRPAPGGGLTVAWSGTLGESLFAPHPATWLRPGHEALAAFCDRIGPALRASDSRLVFEPHCRHVLSDAHSCRSFVRERNDLSFGVALAPATMLEPSMLPDMEDHLQRMFETLGPHADLLVLEDVHEDGDGLATVALGAGVLPREHLVALIHAHVPASTPIVLRGNDIQSELAWLGMS